MRAAAGHVDISIHALRAEGDQIPQQLARPAETISIHALRAEGDQPWQSSQIGSRFISIHALRAEGDGYKSSSANPVLSFLSTPSVRRATLMRPAMLDTI